MQVPRLGSDSGVVLQQLGQPPHPGQPQDVDVIVAAEGLQEREVDLERDVVIVLLIRGQHAQNHAVRVPAGRAETNGSGSGGAERPISERTGGTYTFMSLADS